MSITALLIEDFRQSDLTKKNLDLINYIKSTLQSWLKPTHSIKSIKLIKPLQLMKYKYEINNYQTHEGQTYSSIIFEMSWKSITAIISMTSYNS